MRWRGSPGNLGQILAEGQRASAADVVMMLAVSGIVRSMLLIAALLTAASTLLHHGSRMAVTASSGAAISHRGFLMRHGTRERGGKNAENQKPCQKATHCP